MYRKPCKKELTVLKREFNKWGIFDFVSDKAIVINDHGLNKAKEVHLLSTQLEMFTSRRKPFYSGLKIGELKKNSCPPYREQTL
jgi:hypothetical protein